MEITRIKLKRGSDAGSKINELRPTHTKMKAGGSSKVKLKHDFPMFYNIPNSKLNLKLDQANIYLVTNNYEQLSEKNKIAILYKVSGDRFSFKLNKKAKLEFPVNPQIIFEAIVKYLDTNTDRPTEHQILRNEYIMGYLNNPYNSNGKTFRTRKSHYKRQSLKTLSI